MDAQVLKTAAQVAGIGGIALGVFLLLFRDIVRKNPRFPIARAVQLTQS
jgi:hypothetical protein